MSRVCTVCRHSQRPEIDRALFIGKVSNRAIAAQHTLSEQAVRRHKAQHLPDVMAIGGGADDSTHLDLAILVRRLFADARRLQSKAEDSGDYNTALRAIREITRLIELAIDTGEAQPKPEQQRVVKVVWQMDGHELPPSQQVTTVPPHPPSGPAGSVAAGISTALSTKLVDNGPLDNNARAVPAQKPRARRRQYRGY